MFSQCGTQSLRQTSLSTSVFLFDFIVEIISHNDITWSSCVHFFQFQFCFNPTSSPSIVVCKKVVLVTQIIDVLSCMAGLIAAQWPCTLGAPRATVLPHTAQCWTGVWFKLEWRDTREGDLASGMEFSFNTISQTWRYLNYQVCLYSRRLFHRIRAQYHLSTAWRRK